MAAERVTAWLLSLPEGLSAAQVLEPTQRRVLIAAGVVVVASALALARLRWPNTAAATAAAVAVLAVGDLAIYHRHPNRVGSRALVTYEPELLKAIKGNPGRLYVYDYGTPGPSAKGLAYSLARQPDGWDLESAFALAMQMYLAPESGGRWGLRGSYELDYRGLYSATLDAGVRFLRATEGTPFHLRLLQIGAVSHVLTLHTRGFEDLRPQAELPGLFKEPIRLLGVPDPLPRAYAVGGWQVAPEAEALRFLAESTLDPRREIVLAAGDPMPVAEGFEGEAAIVAERPDRVRIVARLSHPGCVVLVDGFDPGWAATVDGQPAPVLRANGLFRAVKVAAGAHQIEFVYRPWSVRLGLAIALATALGMAVIAARDRGSAAGEGPPSRGVPS
jgi:hypothetical protein